MNLKKRRWVALPILVLILTLMTLEQISAAPAGYVETTISLDAPPVGLAFGPGGVLYALEGADFNSNEATLRTINPDGTFGASIPVVGDDPSNFFVGAMTYDSLTDRVLITDNTGDGRLYAVDSAGVRDIVATGIAGIAGVAVRTSGEIFVSTAPFNMPGEVRIVDRATGQSQAALSELGFGAGIAFDENQDLIVLDAAVTAPFAGRAQKLPIHESQAGLTYGMATTLVGDTQAAGGVAVDSDGEIFITGSGGLFVLEGTPLDDVSFSSNGSPGQFATAIAFDARTRSFQPFAGPAGGRLAFMADFGFSQEDNFVTIITPAVPQDANSDGAVDGGDLAVWGQNFGVSPAGPAGGDSDADGDVDGSDFLAWQRALDGGALTIFADAAVPEPAAVQIIFASALILLGKTARRGNVNSAT